MAACPEPPASEQIVELARIGAADLDPLLVEEVAAWRARLHWDFGPAADLVRRYVSMRALNGFALVVDSRTAGYSYFVCEERKGLVGDLFVSAERHSPSNERRLLEATVRAMMETPAVRRIESQLMMLGTLPRAGTPFQAFAQLYDRRFMVIDLEGRTPPAPGKPAHSVSINSWDDRFHEDAAHLIPAAYAGHIDARINDQYCSVAGSRRFLTNIAQYPGCGAFFPKASMVAFRPGSRSLCGLSLASLVAPDIGHITQVCVAPEVRGSGVGYELLRRSLAVLESHGCRKVSLTVTAANRNAVELYERLGFRTAQMFSAVVWEGF